MDKLLQAQKDGVVIGLKDVAGQAPRLDIDELLVKQPDTFNLLCLALNDLQDDSALDKMSFYEITGIHGLPKKPWDGVQVPDKEQSSTTSSGYCVHGEPTFPTWHRPYLSMMEQTIYARAAQTVNLFPAAAQPKYRAALKQLRLPYWDYYRPRGYVTHFSGVVSSGQTQFPYDFSLPQIFTVQQIMLRTTAKDEPTLTRNPFYRFSFPQQGGLSPADWKLANIHLGGGNLSFYQGWTNRYPSRKAPSGDNFVMLNEALNKAREGNTSLILSMIKDRVYSDIYTFSTFMQTPGASSSLEAIHGQYHVLVGGTAGHMGTVDVAAFDPVFWMHHCQIDRWFAIWQAVHPDNWYDDPEVDEAALLPFRTTPGNATWYDSNGSRQTDSFGYYYKDAANLNASQALANFERLYRWSVRTGPTRQFGKPPSDMEPLSVVKAPVFAYTSSVASTASQVANTVQTSVLSGMSRAADTLSGALSGATEPKEESSFDEEPITNPPVGIAQTPLKADYSKGGAYTNIGDSSNVKIAPDNVDETKYIREWYVDNVVERLALNGSFTIFYFIGDRIEGAPEEYSVAPTCAGLSHIFTSTTAACSNCATHDTQGHPITDSTPITPILLDYLGTGALANLTPAAVIPFLEKKLKWRVVDVSGQQVDPRTIPSLKIGVSSKLTPIDDVPGDDIEPAYQEFPLITEHIIQNAS